MYDVVRLGRRIMVQRRYRDPSTGRDGVSEVVGVVTAVRPGSMRLLDRAGQVVEVSFGGIGALRAVPPARTGAGPAHLAVSVEDLERVGHDGWRPPNEASLGEWVLRAAGGVTGRANSVLAVGSPGVPLDEAVGRVREWYAGHRLPAMVQVSGPVGFDPEGHPTGSVAMRLGMTERVRVLVMTGARPALVRAGAAYPLPHEYSVLVEDSLDPGWAAAYLASTQRRPEQAEHVTSLLGSAPGQLFGSVAGPAGETVAVVRVATSPGWAGVFGLWTDPTLRRQGVASALLSAVLDRVDPKTRAVYLQVSADNVAAVAAYRRLGFVDHHEYVCLEDRADPGATSGC